MNLNLIKRSVFSKGLLSLLRQKAYSFSTPASPVTVEDFNKIQIRVGKITECSVNPNSEHLYLEKVDFNFKTLQIGSKLAKFLPQSEMLAGHVLVITNMKPRKLAGIQSEGMILAVSDEKTIKLLRPPKQAQIGQLVFLAGETLNNQERPVLNPKKKILEDCLDRLKIQEDLSVTFLGKQLVVGENFPIKSQIKGKIN